MDLTKERDNLNSILSNLDERLEGFKDLLIDSVSFEIDFSIESIKYVELLLKHLQVKAKNDIELKKDAALYIGQTIKLNFNGEWDIYDDEGTEFHLQPYVKFLDVNHNNFFPFLSINKYFENPEIGFFLKTLGEKKKLIDISIQLGHPKINSIPAKEFAAVKDVFLELFHPNEERLFLFWNHIPIQFQYHNLIQNFDEILAMNWLLQKENQGKTKATLTNDVLTIELHLFWENDDLKIESYFNAIDEKHQTYTDALSENSIINFSKQSFLNEWNTLLKQILTAFDAANVTIVDGTERRKMELLNQVEQAINGYGKLYIK